MTQNEMILRHMEEVGEITPAEAIQEYGCYRLSARIADLRRRGIKIKSRPVSYKNRYGKNTRFAAYSLMKENEK